MPASCCEPCFVGCRTELNECSWLTHRDFGARSRRPDVSRSASRPGHCSSVLSVGVPQEGRAPIGALVGRDASIERLHRPADPFKAIVVQQEMDGTHVSSQTSETRSSCKNRILRCSAPKLGKKTLVGRAPASRLWFTRVSDTDRGYSA
jgi:hypothetical protein